MSITEYGKESVQRSYEHAKYELDEAERKLKQAKDRVAYMEKVINCKHDNVEEIGGIELIQYKCHDCGYSWFD